MPTFSTQTNILNEPLCLLLQGAPGSGKTTLALQFPGVGLLDFNCNLQGPTEYLRSIKRDVTFEYETVRFDDKRAVVPREQQFVRALDCAKRLAANDKVKTIVADDLTEISQLIIDDLEARHSKEMEQSMWIPYRKALLLITNTLKGSGKHFIMLCHEEYKYKAAGPKDRTEVISKRTPCMDSKLRDQYGGFFSDYWRCSAAPGVLGKTSFAVETVRTDLDDLKKRTFLLPGRVDVTEKGFAALNEYIKLT